MYDTPIAKQPPRNAWILALAGLGAFMAALDVVVVSTALPTLHHRPALGDVFGIAILAAIFAAHGGYATHATLRMACHAATIPHKALLPGQLADVVGYRRRPVRNPGLRAGPRYPGPGR